MKKINKSRYAILGMLFDKPRSGYEIKSKMLESTAHFWQESDASIYPMLKKLETEGKVASRDELVGKRARKIFEITQPGKDEFCAWMKLMPESESHRDEMLLKLFFGANSSKETILKHLQSKLEKCTKMKAVFTIIQIDKFSQVSETHPHKIYWKMALQNGIIQIDAQIKWLNDCIKILEENVGG